MWGRHAGVRLHGIAFGDTVESFAPLQQLTCLSGGTFALSGCSARGLCQAFSSVSSSIASIQGSADRESVDYGPCGPRHALRHVDFEPPEDVVFACKKGVVRFRASRTSFRYDGQAFEKEDWVAGPVERRQRPYMQGGMRLVYGFKDDRAVDGSSGRLVAKLSRFSDPRFSCASVVEAHVKSTAVARYFAAQFEMQTREASMKIPAMIFVPCFIYTAEDPTVGGLQESAVFSAEWYLPGAFLKYNSNNGYVGEKSLCHDDAVQAFLHFSFVSSGGSLAVTDLQGVARKSEVLLTDPQVLTVAGGNFGPGDLGARGLRACLAAHRCGPTCKKLGLKPIGSPLLRRLEAAAPQRRRAESQGMASWAQSGSSWERLSLGVESQELDWERLGESGLAHCVGDDVRSTKTSGSSWVHVL